MTTAKKKVVLACGECGERNYKAQRSTGPEAKALTLKKFCSKCNKHTIHHESH
jgi:large subunit ribosomal protein L33